MLSADPSVTVHTGVWSRHAGGTTIAAAVFAELKQGRYEILDHGEAVQTVEITGGAVATADLRTSSNDEHTPA